MATDVVSKVANNSVGSPVAAPSITPTKNQRSLVSILDERADVRAEATKRGGDVYKVGTKANDYANWWWNNYGVKEYPNVELSQPIAPKISVSDVKTPEDANKFINQNQPDQISDLPQSRTNFSSVSDISEKVNSDIESTLADKGLKKPESYNAEQSFTDLITKYKTEDLENNLNALQSRREMLQSGLNQINEEEGSAKGVAMRVIDGRRSENTRTMQYELDNLDNQINSITRQLNTKYNAISMIMSYKNLDYTNASNAYNNAFNQAMSVMNYSNNLANTEYTQQKAEEDTARANLQVIYNGIKESGKSVDSLDPTQKAMISSLETQAGLPIGFYKNFEKNNPGGTVVTTSSWTAADGTKYASVITRDDKTGALKTTNLPLGKEKTSSGSSDTPSSYKEWLLAGGAKSGYTYAEWAKGGDNSSAKEENDQIQKLRSDAADMIEKLDSGKISWGTAWGELHTKYPQASAAKIDELLGGSWNPTTGPTGRAVGKD